MYALEATSTFSYWDLVSLYSQQKDAEARRSQQCSLKLPEQSDPAESKQECIYQHMRQLMQWKTHGNTAESARPEWAAQWNWRGPRTASLHAPRAAAKIGYHHSTCRPVASTATSSKSSSQSKAAVLRRAVKGLCGGGYPHLSFTVS